MKKVLLILFFSGLVVGGLLAGNSFVSAATCGNGVCETGESNANCPQDCQAGAGTLEGPPEKCTMKRDVKVSGCPATGECVFASNPECGICLTLFTESLTGSLSF